NDLDVEEDEQHRGQVEADGEALPAHRPRGDARLERDGAVADHPPRPLREREARGDHRRRDRQREEAVDQEGEPVVEHGGARLRAGNAGALTLSRPPARVGLYRTRRTDSPARGVPALRPWV